MAGSRAAKAQEKKVELTPSIEHKTPGTVSHQGTGATCMRFFFSCRKATRRTEARINLRQKHRRQHQRACKVSPVFDLFKEWLLQLRGKLFRGGTVSSTRSAAGRWEPAGCLSHGAPYPHSLFYSSGACMQSGTGIRSCPLCSRRPADSLRC